MSSSQDFAKTIGEDLTAQHGLWRFQRFGLAVMVLIVLASVLGFIATGPFSARLEKETEGFKIIYDRVAHYGETHQMEFVLMDSQELEFSAEFSSAARIESVLPQPARMIQEGSTLRMVFDPAGSGAEQRVLVQYKLERRGLLRGEFKDGKNREIHLTLINFP